MDFKDGRLSGARFMVYCLAWYHEIHDSVKSLGKFSHSFCVLFFTIDHIFLGSSFWLLSGKCLLDN